MLLAEVMYLGVMKVMSCKTFLAPIMSRSIDDLAFFGYVPQANRGMTAKREEHLLSQACATVRWGICTHLDGLKYLFSLMEWLSDMDPSAWRFKYIILSSLKSGEEKLNIKVLQVQPCLIFWPIAAW